MALPVAAALAGTAAAAAYLDAKFHVRNDLSAGSLSNSSAEAQKFIASKQAEDRLLLYHVIENHATGKLRDHLFLEFEGRSWTYGQFFQTLQYVGDWLMNDLGIQKGEIIALDGPNTAEYLMLWYALDGIGAKVTFLNSNLTGASFMHCITLCETRYLLVDKALQAVVDDCSKELEEAGCKPIFFEQATLDRLHTRTTAQIPRSRNTGMMFDELRIMMYTSGTTGMPKAVEMVTGRIINTGKKIAEYLKLKPEDKFYTCLPLYHGAAQGLCMEPVMHAGASVCLGRKFSHKTFWPEVSACGANRLQYVGELARYLVNAPKHPLETSHNVQEAWGNGMRPDVWEKFRQRFNIPLIHELYAATDGLGASFLPNKGEFSRNAIGVRGLIWHLRNGSAETRVRIDPDTEQIVRQEGTNYAIKCDVNEPGEVLIQVPPEMKGPIFKGYYRNPEATEKRWMTDVFKQGDLWFRSGDVMRLDAEGRLFFVDRLGDTFRWKSENVSTNEVSDVLGLFHQLDESNVYGVSVPNSDGRAGCATVVLRPPTTPETLDLQGLAQHVLARLPRYAVPLFIRVAPSLSYTGTFKIQKGKAKREGVNIDLIEEAGSKDKIFWLPPHATSYVPYERKDWEALKNGDVKL